MIEMPSRPEVIPHLLAALAKHPSGVAPMNIYADVAARMKVTLEQQSAEYSDGRLKWHILLQAARESLAQRGLLVRALRGYWKLTPRGRQLARQRTHGADRLVFVRVGWMEAYGAWEIPGGEEPRGGGAYNRDSVGGEASNFQVAADGRLYGYVQTPGDAYGFNLSRIDPSHDDPELVADVLVVFLATEPSGGGQRIVGWYGQSTCFAEHHEHGDRWANVVADANDCVLLPLDERLRGPRIPRGEGAPGQSNVFYTTDGSGDRRRASWIKGVVAFVLGYQGPNGLVRTEATQFNHAGSGQGFLRSAEARKAIEMWAMECAEAFFQAEGWKVRDVSATSSYDLHGTKNGADLHIEVKGTMQDGSEVLMTANEVDLLREKAPDCALYVLHGVHLRHDGESGWDASAGEESVYWPFRSEECELRPLSYRVGLPE